MQTHITNIAVSTELADTGPDKPGPAGDGRPTVSLERYFAPVLAPLLSKRSLTAMFLGVGLTQLILAATGLNGWQCPLQRALDLACPGCGLTRAVILLARGRWAAAVEMHAFAPLFLVVLASMAAAISLPAVYRERFTAAVAVLERKTGITAIVVTAMLIYWLQRVFG